MGQAAAPAAPLLRSVAAQPFGPPTAIEALGNCGAPEDVEMLVGLLEPGQGITERQAAALRGLIRLGPDAVRSHRDLLPRFVYAQRSMGPDGTHSTGVLAAALLIGLNPDREELGAIGQLSPRWRQEALWSAPLLPLPDAIAMLQATLQQSGRLYHLWDDHSALDYRDDPMADDRFAALAASMRLGDDIVPLLPSILFRAVYDLPRNRRLADGIVVALGGVAVPALRDQIFTYCRNEELRELYFGEVLAGLESASDPDEIRALLARGITVLRDIARIQDEQSLRDQEARRAERTPPPPVPPTSQEPSQAPFRKAPGRSDALTQQALEAVARAERSVELPIDALIVLTRDPRYRRQAFAALADLGAAASPALPVLQRALTDRDPVVRTHAVRAIGHLGEVATPALPVLRQLLYFRRGPRRQAQGDVRREAVIAVGHLWPLTRSFLPDLIAVLLKDSAAVVRAAAADVLGEVGPADADVLDALYSAQSRSPTDAWSSDWEHAIIALEMVLQRLDDAGALMAAGASAATPLDQKHGPRPLWVRLRAALAGSRSRARGHHPT